MSDKTFGEWLFEDIHENEYLKKLYSKLICEYTKNLIGDNYTLSEKDISDLLTFSDILSKSTSIKNQDFHKNIAQNITTIIKKLYPNNLKVDYYTGSVLSNVQNYVGLEHQCPEYYNTDVMENISEFICKEMHKVPFGLNQQTIFFNHSQKIAFEKMNNASMYSFSGPTSMGKTFLIKAFIHNLIENNAKSNFVVIVPSKALINEIKNDFVKEFGDTLQKNNYKVITSSAAISTISCNYIMIYTQERYLFHLNDFPLLNVDYLFIDEAQKISEVGLRSAYFYKIIDQSINLFPNLKLFFACPNIPNPEVYFEILPINIEKEKENNTFKFSPVNQHKCIYDYERATLSIFNDLSSEFEIMPYKENESLLSLLKQIGKDCNNIVFLDSKNDVVDNAVKYAETCTYIIASITEVENRDELLELINDIKKDVHPKCYLIDLLRKGVSYHVGYLPATIKDKIEKLYKKKIIKTIFCTSTLLEGVNLPADNLFIGVKNSSYILKNSATFKNLIGRVGRKTYNLVGNVFVVPCIMDNADIVIDQCRDLIQKPVEPQALSIEKALEEKTKKRIINALTSGLTSISKTGLTYDQYDLARFALNILLNNIIHKTYTSRVYQSFVPLLDKEKRDKIYENFKNVDIALDDSKVTNDQINNLVIDIKAGKIAYPDTLDYINIKLFLEELFVYFNWDKYESHCTIGKKSKLAYYSVLLNQWMRGQNISQIINQAIKHYTEVGKIYNIREREFESFINSPEQINRIIVDCLTDIEDVLLFQLSNYFIKFSNLYKKTLKLDSLKNDWSEYLDFGTNDKTVIELQKLGFSREVAKKLMENSGYLLIQNGFVKISNKAFDSENMRVIEELNIAKINYPEIF